VSNRPFNFIDHVQLAMSAGKEEQARAFYGNLLGMVKIEKPFESKKRGGWTSADRSGTWN